MVDRGSLTTLCNTIPATHRPLTDALQGSARYTISKPNLSLKKAHIALSIIVRDLYAKYMEKDGTKSELRTLLNNKNFTEKIKPRRMYLLMNLIQKMTAMDANELINTKVAQMVLDYLIDVTKWYIQNLSKGERLTKAALLDVEYLPIANDSEMLDLATHDYEDAAKWFLMAAQEGNSSAQYNLGVLYNHGKGVKRNYIQAAKWYKLAAEQQDAIA